MALRLKLDQIMSDKALGQGTYSVYAQVYDDTTNGIIETIQVSGKDLEDVKTKIRAAYKKIVEKAQYAAILEAKLKKALKDIEQDVLREIQKEAE